MPALDEKSASLLALTLAVAGLLGLYFWPQALAYEKMQPALVAIAEDGQKAQVEGVASSVGEKESSTSIRLCDNSCIPVSAAKNADVDYAVLKGDRIIVFGQVASYKYAKFIRAEKIVHTK